MVNDFYLVIAILNLALGFFGALLLLHRYRYLRSRFHPQEKVLWLGFAASYLSLGLYFLATIFEDVQGAWWQLFLTVSMAVVDGALLRPFGPDRER